MEKEILIKPASKDLAAKVQALKLINEFAVLGFNSRGAFMAIVCHYFSKYKNKRDNLRLSNWYYGKFTDDKMQSDMEIVINKLKTE